MSHIQTDNWIEACVENFQECIERGDYIGATACIGDMADVSRETAQQMQTELDLTPIINFNRVSPIQRHNL